jgi:PPOX class probable F420-dependent enzyme
MLDLNTEFGVRADRRLREEIMIWLTTVRADLTPQPSPVWFLWDGSTILIYSRPDTPKIRNITRQPTIALHLDGDGQGGNIVILTGKAAIDKNAPPATDVADFVAKYQGSMKRINTTPEIYAQAYSTAIRVTPTSIRGH